MHHLRRLLTKEQICTVPNLMSLLRLLLLPFIICAYWNSRYRLAAGLVLLSAATDVLDGVVARRFHMVSELGKVLDPICDKLTHAVLCICLTRRYHAMWLVFALLAVKEITMFVMGAIMVKRRGQFQSAKWYGKLCTVTIEAVMTALILFPDLPAQAVPWLLGLCCCAMLLSLVMYIVFFAGLILAKDD